MLPQALRLVVDFVWRRIYCDHIRLELFHLTNEETKKMAADPAITAALKAEKFRWKSLINDPKTGKRAQIMDLKKPAADQLPPFENSRGLNPGQEPIMIKTAMLMRVEEGAVPSATLPPAEGKVQAPLSIISCLQKFLAESAASTTTLEGLNSSLADAQVKKSLKLADAVKGDSDVSFLATKQALETSLDIATEAIRS